MCEVCRICGARLSVPSVDGLGAECRAALHKAQKAQFLDIEANRLKYYYTIEAEIIRTEFLRLYDGVKFRSSFRARFYESMQNAPRVSRKQLDICVQMIEQRDAWSDYRKRINEAREAYIAQAYNIEVSREAVEIARAEIRKGKKR
jgi:hypothetical protein